MTKDTLHFFHKKYKRRLSRDLRVYLQSLILRGPGEWSNWKVILKGRERARLFLYQIESPSHEVFYPIYDSLRKQIIDFKGG